MTARADTQGAVRRKYANPAVVTFWQQLARSGLQQAEQEMAARYLPPAGHLLDLGCGAGRAVLALSRQGYQVTGIDLSQPMLGAGRALWPQMRLGGANLLALPFAGAAFDAAFMFFGALQHIPGRMQRRGALAEMGRVVPPGGRLLLGLDNLAPALTCYGYWLRRKITQPASQPANKPASQQTTPPANKPPPSTDATLWQRRSNPLLWHLRGLLRSLRWRTWPGLVDRYRQVWGAPTGPQPGDVQVAQFSQPATPGKIYYHIYPAGELIADAASAGWRLLDFHSGSELAGGATEPARIRALDKQLFFAFERE